MSPSTIEVCLTPELQTMLSEEMARTGSSPNRVVMDALHDWLRRCLRHRDVESEIARYTAVNAGTEFDLDPILEAAGLECISRDDEP